MAGRHGILLLAHGSRDPLWRKPIEAVAARVSELAPQAVVRCAYLELTEPALPDAAAQLVAEGAGRIRVLPLFLGVGKHAREDLPRLVDALRTAHPEVVFELQAAVGEDPRLVDLMARIAVG